jgi:hypothetical protein
MREYGGVDGFEEPVVEIWQRGWVGVWALGLGDELDGVGEGEGILSGLVERCGGNAA